MENKSKIPKKIQLVFPRLKEQDVHLPKDLSQYKDKKFFELFEIDVDELSTWFEGFRVESIELFVDSVINSSDQTNLIVGGRQDQKGIMFLLKPKDQDKNKDKMVVESQLHKSQNFGGMSKDD
jgi:hypothetical protein